MIHDITQHPPLPLSPTFSSLSLHPNSNYYQFSSLIKHTQMEDKQPSEGQLNGVGASLVLASSETAGVGPKRQRRPSVRLGDIGGDDSLIRRPSSSKQWRHHSATAAAKTRTLTNLTTDFSKTLDDETEANNNNSKLDGVAIGSWRVKEFNKPGSATKRVRSNWVPKVQDSSGGNTNSNNLETEEDNDDFDMENSESPMKEHSPVHSLDNLGVHGNEREVLYHANNHRRPIPTRVSDQLEFSDGVRIWLNSLGLGRYAPVFEIHEVDGEVLPLLTLEDLKDMGINAVGSRRKMYCAIQKLGEGFS